MADAVEIYLCTPGRKLKEGRLVMAHDSRDKTDAVADCRASQVGGFKTLLGG